MGYEHGTFTPTLKKSQTPQYLLLTIFLTLLKKNK